MPRPKIYSTLGNIGNVMTPLIPFNMIVDTDIGVLELVRKKYLDPDVFNVDYFLSHDRYHTLKDLYHRKVENPLLTVCTEEYERDMDTFYDQFIEREYDYILYESELTEIYDVVGMYMRDSDIHPTIVCDHQVEVDELRSHKLTKNVPILLTPNIGPDNAFEFNQYFFKAIPDAIPYAKGLKKKTIYISRYGFNLGDDGYLMDHPLLTALSIKNRLTMIDVYGRNKFKED